MSNPVDDGSSTPQHPDGQYGQQNPYGAAPDPIPGPQSQPDAGDVSADSAWSQPQPPVDPYAQQSAQDPWAAPPAQDGPGPQQPAQDPYGQPSAQDPFGQSSAQEDPFGQPSAQDPYGQSSAPDPFAQSGASPYGAPPVGGPAPAGAGAAPGEQGQSRLLVGLLGIFLGAFGVHRFLMGYTTIGIIQVAITVLSCFTLSFVSGIWGLVEGIMVLAKSEQFQRDAHGRPLAD